MASGQIFGLVPAPPKTLYATYNETASGDTFTVT